MARYFTTPPKAPTRKEVEAVLVVTDNEDDARNHVLLAVAAGTGLRVHELVALRWGQVVTEAGAVRHRVLLDPEHTKGNVGGEVVLNSALRWKMEKYRGWCRRRDLQVEGDAPVFVSRQGRALSVRMAQNIWKQAQVKAGIERPYGFHGLRHYFGTSVYSATKCIRTTQVLMRHSSITSTQIYTAITARQVEAAAELVAW